jgi:hypothetical protein
MSRKGLPRQDVNLRMQEAENRAWKSDWLARRSRAASHANQPAGALPSVRLIQAVRLIWLVEFEAE